MLKLPKLADYGLLLVSCLSEQEGDLSASVLSRMCRIPLPTVSKVLKLLTQKGLLRSVQGANGGYRLAKKADQISAADVVEAIDGPVLLMNCSAAAIHDCGEEENCPVQLNYRKINLALKDALSSVTVDDLAFANCLSSRNTGETTGKGIQV